MRGDSGTLVTCRNEKLIARKGEFISKFGDQLQQVTQRFAYFTTYCSLNFSRPSGT